MHTPALTAAGDLNVRLEVAPDPDAIEVAVLRPR